jgi:uncharacterized cupredoxin-like copper-binding protein
MHRMTLSSLARPLPLLAAAVILGGCLRPMVGSVSPAPAQAPASSPPVIDIMASDYAFDAPDMLPAGLVTVRLMNHGQEPHHAQLLRLNDGVTLDEFTSALQAEGDAALGMVTVAGGPGALDPHKTTEVTLDLAPGTYVLACFIASPDGVPHLAKGMLKPFTVASAPADASAAPQVNGTLTLRDFTFDIPDTIPAGKVTYKVVNQGPQPHELNILKLAPGKTTQDVLAWMADPSTPPPFEAVGGMNGLGAAVDGYMTVDLQPGSYVAICNIPDPGSGWPHSRLGMIRTFTVS